MKQALFLFLFLITTCLVVQNELTITNSNISFEFSSKHVEGTIMGFNSSSTLNKTDFSKSILDGSVAVETIKTGNFVRDWSLKGKKYFDADNFPKIYFKSTLIDVKDEKINVKGILTIKGISKPVNIVFISNANQLIGTTSIYSSDFNIYIKKEREENKVTIKIVFDLE